MLGVINTALPFTLIAWGELHVTSSIAGIANAPVPIFVALLAIKFRPSETVSGMRLVGIILGFLGVAVLAGLHPEGGWWAAAGTLAVVLASLFVRGREPVHAGPLHDDEAARARHRLVDRRVPASSPRSRSSACPRRRRAPRRSARSPCSASSGPRSRYCSSSGCSWHTAPRSTALVTYLIPPFAVAYGVSILDDPLPLNAILGLALILGGVALGSGAFRFTRTREAVATPQRP